TPRCRVRDGRLARCRSTRPAREQELGQVTVGGRGDLEVVLAPLDQHRVEAGQLHRHRLVGYLDPVAPGLQQCRGERAASESLRRECTPKLLARLGGDYPAICIGALEGVTYRRGQQCAVVTYSR